MISKLKKLSAGFSLTGLIGHSDNINMQGAKNKKKKYPKFLDKTFALIDAVINFILKRESNNVNEVLKVTWGPLSFGLIVILIFFGIGGIWSAIALSEAIKMYEESLRYLSEKNSYLVKLALSHILLLHSDAKKAIFYLEQILNVEPNNAFVWKYLSIAYKCDADAAMYYFALTKKACIEGDLKQFTKYAELAVKTLPKDSPYLLQVEDMKRFNG